jgi:hypothetical protein
MCKWEGKLGNEKRKGKQQGEGGKEQAGKSRQETNRVKE